MRGNIIPACQRTGGNGHKTSQSCKQDRACTHRHEENELIQHWRSRCKRIHHVHPYSGSRKSADQDQTAHRSPCCSSWKNVISHNQLGHMPWHCHSTSRLVTQKDRSHSWFSCCLRWKFHLYLMYQ